MSTLIMDATVAVGKYTDKNGQEKTRWENVGEVYKGDNQNTFLMMKATFNPAGVMREPGSDRIMIAFFPHKDNRKGNSNNYSNNNQNNNQQQAQQPPLQQHNGEFSAFDPSSFQGTGQNTASGFPPF